MDEQDFAYLARRAEHVPIERAPRVSGSAREFYALAEENTGDARVTARVVADRARLAGRIAELKGDERV